MVKKVKKADKKKPVKISAKNIKGANFPAKRIPSNVLKRTLEIATNPIDSFWLKKNTSCVNPITYELYHGKSPSPTVEKLRLARSCLMQRDYKNLAKLLASDFVGDTVLKRDSYTVFAEYAEILKKFTKLYDSKQFKQNITDKKLNGVSKNSLESEPELEV